MAESTDRLAASVDVANLAAGDVLAANVVAGFSLAAMVERAAAVVVVLGADLTREAADAVVVVVVVVGLAGTRAVTVDGLVTVLMLRGERMNPIK